MATITSIPRPQEMPVRPRAGLLADGAPVPLEHVDVHATLSDDTADVTITQRFRNTERKPLEVVYVFPLDEGAAIRRFEAIVDGVTFVGRVKEREEAFGDYADALEQGHGAYLLDAERADVFTARLGNLAPGSEVRLTVGYVTELATEGRAVRFTLPTTVAPRYAPVEDTIGVGLTDAEALNPPCALDLPYGFSFDATVRTQRRLLRIESPSHPLSIEQREREAHVTLAQRQAAMDRDLILVVEAEAPDVPCVVVERGAQGEAVVVSWVPRFDAARAPAEVVFLVDRSGSMEGTSIAEVRNALQLCLRSLTEGCAFNIVGFGSHYEALFPASRRYDDDSLKAADEHVAALDANLGGTELLPALQHVLEAPEIEGLPRQVVVLTDGQVTSTSPRSRSRGRTRRAHASSPSASAPAPASTWCGDWRVPAAAAPSSWRPGSASKRRCCGSSRASSRRR